MSDSRLYCTFPFADTSQLTPCLISIIHILICLSVICYSYIGIYRFYRMAGRIRQGTKRNDSVLQTQAFKDASQKKGEDNELKVLLTTVILVGWTLIGNFVLDIIK
jgi:hypothetical protein